MKAEIVLENPSHVNSGSIITFEERTGVCLTILPVCFHVPCCGTESQTDLRAGFQRGRVGRTCPGNQVYDTKEEQWINVDTTFGNSDTIISTTRTFLRIINITSFRQNGSGILYKARGDAYASSRHLKIGSFICASKKPTKSSIERVRSNFNGIL